MYGQANMVPM